MNHTNNNPAFKDYDRNSGTVLYVLGKAYPVEFTIHLKKIIETIPGVRDCFGIIAYNRESGVNTVRTINVTYETHRLDNEKLFIKVGEMINKEKIKYEFNHMED